MKRTMRTIVTGASLATMLFATGCQKQEEQTRNTSPNTSCYEFYDYDSDGIYDAYRSRCLSSTPGSIEGRLYFRPGFGPERGGAEEIGLGYDWCDSTYIQELAKAEPELK